MGTYCTTTSLQTLMIGTTFDTATTNLASKCISQAEDEIDKYLSGRYDISSAYFQTSTSTPPIITTICETLAQGYTYEQMARGPDVPKRAERLIKRALDNLSAIAAFKMHLTDSAGSVVPEASSSNYRVQCNTTDYAHTFNEDDELSWAVDGSKLDDIAAERE